MQCLVWRRNNIDYINECILLKSLLIYTKLTMRKVDSLFWTFQPNSVNVMRESKHLKYLVMLSIFALRPYFLMVCIDVLQSQSFLGTWGSWELQQEHYPDLNNVEIDTRQADRKRERKEEGKKVVCLKSHVAGKAVLRNRSSNFLCKAFSILQPIKCIFKSIQLNRKQNKRVYNISAVPYAGQETFRAYWVLLKEIEI